MSQSTLDDMTVEEAKAQYDALVERVTEYVKEQMRSSVWSLDQAERFCGAVQIEVPVPWATETTEGMTYVVVKIPFAAMSEEQSRRYVRDVYNTMYRSYNHIVMGVENT